VPSKNQGRLALRISSAASAMLCSAMLSIGWVPLSPAPPPQNRNSAVACCASFVDVDQYRPGRPEPATRNASRQYWRYIFGTGDDVVMLGHRQRDAGDVHFLECVGAKTLLPTWPVIHTSGIESSIAGWQCR